PKQWDRLVPTEESTTRACHLCHHRVHYCSTVQQAQSHVANGNRVALSLALCREVNDLHFPSQFARTRVAPDEIERIQRASRLAERLGFPDPDTELIEQSFGGRGRPTAIRGLLLRKCQSRQERSTHNKKRQRRNRNIQRENWEEME